ncbi:MAG: YibE/F family protein [bacterium]|nr:YibE/F family protein [bacterium]
MMLRRCVGALTLFVLFTIPVPVIGAEQPLVSGPDEATWRAIVRSVHVSAPAEADPNTGARRRLDLEFVEGPHRGRVVSTHYDLVPLEPGDAAFVRYLQTPDGEEIFAVEEPDRRGALAWLVALFVVLVVIFGRAQGVRALLSLAIGVAAIAMVLVPRIAAGASPVLWSALVAIGVLALALFLTHGVHRRAVAAFLGVSLTIIGTVLLAHMAVAATGLSGYADETAFYLDIEAGGRLDLRGLLLAAIIIGVIGVLDDVAITQAAAVEEIASAGPSLTRREVYIRAMRVGREHVGALVNTLVLAYTGAALPLLLLLRGAPLLQTLNREIVAVEIVRAIIGSIGVIVCVPITTAIATALLVRSAHFEHGRP